MNRNSCLIISLSINNNNNTNTNSKTRPCVLKSIINCKSKHFWTSSHFYVELNKLTFDFDFLENH